MTDQDIDSRLRGVENKLAELGELVRDNLGSTVERLARAEDLLYGSSEFPGMVIRLDRVERSDAVRKRLLYLAISAAFTALATTILRVILK